MTDWSTLIRDVRRERGLKQEVLALMLGVDQTTVSRWERGRDRPSIAMQKHIRDVLWKGGDDALSAAVKLVRCSPCRASLVRPGTLLVEVSDSLPERLGLSRAELKGTLLRKHFGDAFYERSMVPVGAVGIYGGEVARVDYVAGFTGPGGKREYSHSTVVPIITPDGIFACSQSVTIDAVRAAEMPAMRVRHYDEMID